MSGHSKWATTKRQKAVVDAKKGAIFTKLGKLITVAVREKGGNPETNFSLRIAIDKARDVNMPKENIERAVKRGTGELEGEQIEELIYEGIGPAKSQFIIRCLTNSKNRAAAQIRHIFSEYGGSLGTVAWNFETKGVLRVKKEEVEAKNISAEDFEMELIDAGADDLKKEEEGIIIYTKIEDWQKVNQFLEKKGIKAESAEIEYVAKEEMEASAEDYAKIEKFITALEENEDVSDYYSNVKNV